MKNVMIFGTFDLFHEGHRFLVEEARKRGHVTAVVARSKNVERIKGRPPEESDDERVRILSSTFPDITVILGDPTDFLRPIRQHTPDLLLFGYDQGLPPGITETDIPCPVERAGSYRPEVFKSSLMKQRRKTGD